MFSLTHGMVFGRLWWKDGHFHAWFAIIAVPVVLFTFIGVNTLLPGLHSYGAVIRSML